MGLAMGCYGRLFPYPDRRSDPQLEKRSLETNLLSAAWQGDSDGGAGCAGGAVERGDGCPPVHAALPNPGRSFLHHRLPLPPHVLRICAAHHLLGLQGKSPGLLDMPCGHCVRTRADTCFRSSGKDPVGVSGLGNQECQGSLERDFCIVGFERPNIDTTKWWSIWWCFPSRTSL